VYAQDYAYQATAQNLGPEVAGVQARRGSWKLVNEKWLDET